MTATPVIAPIPASAVCEPSVSELFTDYRRVREEAGAVRKIAEGLERENQQRLTVIFNTPARSVSDLRVKLRLLPRVANGGRKTAHDRILDDMRRLESDGGDDETE